MAARIGALPSLLGAAMGALVTAVLAFGDPASGERGHSRPKKRFALLKAGR
jgi:hypothetical protein